VSGATRFGPESGSSFRVCERVEKYDHAALETEIEMDIDLNEIVNSHRAKRRKIDVAIPEDTKLDRLFIATLEAAKDEKKK
jgi:hypothetical protein